VKEILKKSLQGLIDELDAGNSNLTEEETLKVVSIIKKYSRRDVPMSKYQACEYTGYRRAQFDNLVREGKLPEGKKVSGFKELFWYKKELDKYIKQYGIRRKNSNI